MTPKQIELVQATWQRVVPISDAATELFYTRLFEIDPSVRKLFAHTDMTAQRLKLVQAITTVVASLERLEEIVPVVEELGRRHAGYGVADAHYDTVGAALLWTLEKGLGNAWSEEAAAAWAETYGILANTMRAAANAVPHAKRLAVTAAA